MHCSLPLSCSLSTPDAIDIPSSPNSQIYSIRSLHFSVKPRFSVVTNPGLRQILSFYFPWYVVTWSSELKHRSFSGCSATAISEVIFFRFIFPPPIYFIPNLYRQHSMHPSIPSLPLTFVETLMKIIAQGPPTECRFQKHIKVNERDVLFSPCAQSITGSHCH